MRINILVPETTIRNTRMSFHLTSKQLQSLQILLILSFLIDRKQYLTRIDMINIITIQSISLNRTIIIHHCIGIIQGIIKILLIARFLCHLNKSLHLKPMSIVPFNLIREINHPALRITLHFRFGHSHIIWLSFSFFLFIASAKSKKRNS